MDDVADVPVFPPTGPVPAPSIDLAIARDPKGVISLLTACPTGPVILRSGPRAVRHVDAEVATAR